MVGLATQYAINLGLLVHTLTARGYMLKLETEKDLFNKELLYIRVHDMKNGKSVRHAFSEADVEAIQDVIIVCDAIAERIRKS
jgi:hypothetical protein